MKDPANWRSRARRKWRIKNEWIGIGLVFGRYGVDGHPRIFYGPSADRKAAFDLALEVLR